MKQLAQLIILALPMFVVPAMIFTKQEDRRPWALLLLIVFLTPLPFLPELIRPTTSLEVGLSKAFVTFLAVIYFTAFVARWTRSYWINSMAPPFLTKVTACILVLGSPAILIIFQ